MSSSTTTTTSFRFLDEDTANDVVTSWEKIRNIDNYDHLAGIELFRRFLLYCPDALLIFGFNKDEIHNKHNDILNNKRFLLHSSLIIDMFENIVTMIEYDTEILPDILLELGKKHLRYGVRAEMFPKMGEALLRTIETLLSKDDFTPKIRSSWIRAYDSLSEHMIFGLWAY